MKKIFLTALFLVFSTSIFWAHDLFLKHDTFFLTPNSNNSISLINGTFEKSENAISRDRMINVSIVDAKNEITHPDTSQWRDVGKRSLLEFNTGDPGTYVIGVSTAAKILKLSAKDFNEYLKHDGVLDILTERKRNNELGRSVSERYSKHVKALIQVGEKHSTSFETRLGYPVEIVPLQNPYKLSRGDSLKVLILKAGKPVENQLIYASHEGFHQHDDQGGHSEAIQTRTDQKGEATIKLMESGRWYIRLINMVPVNDGKADYESNWATLTFEVK